MAFRYRFAVLMDLRQRERDEAGVAVGQANQAIAKIDAERESVMVERQEFRQQRSIGRSGKISVDSLLSSGRYDLQLEADAISLMQTREKLVVERDRRQQRLVEAEAELKRYQKMEQKERAAYDALQLRLQQIEADDATSGKYTRLIQQTSRSED